MEIWACVFTTGDKVSFSFSAGGEFDYDSIEEIDVEHVKGMLSDTLGESFYEAVNGDDPEIEILELLKSDSRYQSVLAMNDGEKEKFVRSYVSEILVSTEASYEADEIDITELMGNEEGGWNDFVFDSISDYVLLELRKQKNGN